MKKISLLFICYLIVSAYDPYYEDDYYYSYTPIVIQRTTLESSIEVQEARDIKDAGRLYLKDNYIYIIEKYKGIHVINNSNPAQPKNERFIRIPGCLNMVIKNNTILADNAVDLVAIDITNMENLSVTSRIRNTFPELETPDHSYIPWEYDKENRPENSVIVGFEEN